MKHLKKLLLTLVILLTLIIGSWTFARNLFTSDANVRQEVVQDRVHVSTGSNSLMLPAKISNPITANPATPILLQSRDGGQTWQDISQGLPGNEQLFAGESDAYAHIKNVHANFKKKSMPTIFETSDGTIFLGDHSLYKSIDRGQSWYKVQTQGWVGEIVESDGVLVATSIKGIMRSTDNGEHWEWVISEGGVGIDVERIEGGFAAISYSNMTKSRRIRISLDGGITWKAIDEELPPSESISSIKQVGNYLLCGHPDGIFQSSDMGKTWSMVHSGVEEPFNLFSITGNKATRDKRKVFKLFVSGNVLYAVARNFGC